LQEYEWELLRDFVYVSPRWGTLTVPAGFVTDLASVPGIARFAVSRDGDHVKPAVLHDYGYVGPDGRPWAFMTRRDVDRLFLEAMRVRGVAPWRRLVIYWAVRVGGWAPWRRYRRPARPVGSGRALAWWRLW
jgi:hypothetical protein